MRRANAWVWDLDDTIKLTVHDYAEPILDACRLIIRTLKGSAPHVTSVINLENEVDKRRVEEINPSTGKQFKWTMERFPGSLVETYRILCLKAGKEPQTAIEQELYEIGLQAFDPSHYKEDIFPDAISVLEFLKSKGDQILLLTKGDKKIQGPKFAVLDAGKRFARVRVVADKTPEIFCEMARGFGGYRLFSVGDNYDSDIAPALKAGYCQGIWIPLVETWDTVGRIAEIRARVDWSRCIELRLLRELVERYDEITRGAQ